MPASPGPDSTAPRRIGHYRIVRELGRGGMGVVYEALQENPMRTVALKVVTAGVMGREALRRFEYEGEVLGLLQHPGIAQIFEAGRTEDEHGGQPYFAMELIRGESISAHAAHAKLDTRARLELIAEVCDAVHHAHQRGVIHRDLKPGNILVDESGHPKVLDFGVARATDSDLRTATLQTDVGQLVGTIPYMSPEQASGDPDKLDTRSDVYALGVVAYELVSGEMPYELDLRAVLEAVRVVREVEARPLSSIDVRLRGDVETLIGKALEKDPERRYPSAAAFAEDIRRYLSDQPITARAPSTFYQLSKFARRNRALVGGLAGVFVALVAGLVGTSMGFVEAESKRVEADKATEAAEISAIQARKTSDFLRAILGGIDPAEARGEDTTLLRKILADTESRIASELADLPSVEAEIRDTLGQTYVAISDARAADPHLRRWFELSRELYGPSDRRTLRAQSMLGANLRALGRLEESEAILGEVSSLAHAQLGAFDPLTLRADKEIAVLAYETDHLEASQQLFEDLLERMRESPGITEDTYVSAGIVYSTVLLERGNTDLAESWLAELLERSRRNLGEDHPWTLQILINSASLEGMLGRGERAGERYLEIIARCTRIFGEEHLSTIEAELGYGFILIRTGRWDQAEALLERVSAICERRFGPDAEISLRARWTRVELLQAQGRVVEALAQQREIAPRVVAALGPRHRDSLAARRRLGQLLRINRIYDEAETVLEAVIADYQEGSGASPRNVLIARDDLAIALAGLGRNEESVLLLRQVYQDTLEFHGPDHRSTLVTHTTLAFALGEMGEYEEAIEIFRTALVDYRRVLGDTDPQTLAVLYNTGSVYSRWGKSREALPYLQEAAEGWQQLAGARHSTSALTRKKLLEVTQELGLPELEESSRRAQLELAREDLGAGNVALGEPLCALAHSLIAQQRGGEALELLEEALDLQSGLSITDRRLAWTQSLYGAALLGEGRVEEAADLLRAAAEQLDGGEPSRTRAAQAWLARLAALESGD